MKSFLKAFVVLLSGAVLGIFIRLAPAALTSNVDWSEVLRLWVAMILVYLWVAAPILLLTALIIAVVYRNPK